MAAGAKKTSHRRKSAREKLGIEREEFGRRFVIPAGMRGSDGRRTMVVPRPLEVESLMRSVRKGRLITVGQIRDALARRAGADVCCPMTTGIFVRLVAEAAEEDRRAGKKRITPYWRTVRDDGSLNEKFPGGVAAQAAALKKEGFVITRKGAKARVAGLETDLSKLVDSTPGTRR